MPGRAAAGTPSAVDDRWIADALETLEFDAVLDVVAGFAAGPLGAARVRATPALRPPKRGSPTSSRWWARWRRSFRRGEKLLAEPVPEVDRPLAHLRVEGAVLEPRELSAIGKLLVAARLVQGELRRVAEECPRAAALACSLPDKRVDQRLLESVDDEGELLDTASPALAAARQAVQQARARLVKRLEGVLRGLESQTSVPDAGRHRAERPVRHSRAARLAQPAVGHRARRVGERRYALHRAGRGGGARQCAARGRSRGGARGAPGAARADADAATRPRGAARCAGDVRRRGRPRGACPLRRGREGRGADGGGSRWPARPRRGAAPAAARCRRRRGPVLAHAGRWGADAARRPGRTPAARRCC